MQTTVCRFLRSVKLALRNALLLETRAGASTAKLCFVLGNEGGDMDSVVSAIYTAYAYQYLGQYPPVPPPSVAADASHEPRAPSAALTTLLANLDSYDESHSSGGPHSRTPRSSSTPRHHQTPDVVYVPLINFARGDLPLRGDIVAALRAAGVNPDDCCFVEGYDKIPAEGIHPLPPSAVPAAPTPSGQRSAPAAQGPLLAVDTPTTSMSRSGRPRRASFIADDAPNMSAVPAPASGDALASFTSVAAAGLNASGTVTSTDNSTSQNTVHQLHASLLRVLQQGQQHAFASSGDGEGCHPVPGSKHHVPRTGLLLVDHNALASRQAQLDPFVVGIIDHHADEGRHKDVALRVIQTCGSVATLATSLYHGFGGIPVPSPALLLGAILLDTRNFDPVTKKTTPLDTAMSDFLSQQLVHLGASTATGEGSPADLANAFSLLQQSQSSFGSTTQHGATLTWSDALRKQWFDALQAAKEDISMLTPAQSLRRDYKRSTFSTKGKPVSIGVAAWVELYESVSGRGAGLEPTEPGNPFWLACLRFAASEDLDMLFIMFSKTTENPDGTTTGRRQLMTVFPRGFSAVVASSNATDGSSSTSFASGSIESPTAVASPKLTTPMITFNEMCFAAVKRFAAQQSSVGLALRDTWVTPDGVAAAFFDQNNTAVSRKTLVPLMAQFFAEQEFTGFPAAGL